MSLDDVKAVAKALVPPGFNPSQRVRFDLTIVGFLAGIWLMSIVHIAIAAGWLSSFGLSGYALASDAASQRQSIDLIQLRQINHDIREAKTNVCLAQQQRNQAALSSWSRTLDEDTGQYYSITKNWPRVLTCDELLVGASIVGN